MLPAPLVCPTLDVIGTKRFPTRHLALRQAYCRALDNDCVMKKNPKTITECFGILKSTVEEFKIKPQNIYNMGEKEFLVGVIKKSRRVLIAADEKQPFFGSMETMKTSL